MATSSEDSNPLRGRTEMYDAREARLAREAAAEKAARNGTHKAARNKRKAERAAKPSEGDFSPNSACDDVIDDILTYLAPIDLRELGMCNAEWRDFVIGEDANGRLAQRCHQVCPRDGNNAVHAILGVPSVPLEITASVNIHWGRAPVLGIFGRSLTGEIQLTTANGHDELAQRLLTWEYPFSCMDLAQVRSELSAVGFDFRPFNAFRSLAKGHAQEEIRSLSADFRDIASDVWSCEDAPDAIAMILYMQHVAREMKLPAAWRTRCRRMAATLFQRLSKVNVLPIVLPLLEDVRKMDALLA